MLLIKSKSESQIASFLPSTHMWYRLITLIFLFPLHCHRHSAADTIYIKNRIRYIGPIYSATSAFTVDIYIHQVMQRRHRSTLTPVTIRLSLSTIQIQHSACFTAYSKETTVTFLRLYFLCFFVHVSPFQIPAGISNYSCLRAFSFCLVVPPFGPGNGGL